MGTPLGLFSPQDKGKMPFERAGVPHSNLVKIVTL